MGRLAAEGIRAGALGFTTSRTLNHRTSRGEPTPTLTAAREELVGIARAIGETGQGVLQVVSDFTDSDVEERDPARDDASVGPAAVDLAAAGRARRSATARVSTCSTPPTPRASPCEPRWRPAPSGSCSASRARSTRWAAPRRSRRSPASPWPSRRGVCPSPSSREQLVAEMQEQRAPVPLDRVFELGDPPEYEPAPEDSVAARAQRAGVDAARAARRPPPRRRGTGPALPAVPELLRRQPRRRRRDARPTPTRSRGSATAAPTSAPSATPASRPRC